MSRVYGIEDKEGYFWNFAQNEFTIWCAQCSLPSEQLANDLHLIMSENEMFIDTKVVPVPVGD